MKRSLLLWQFAGFTFAVVFGTIFHFLYDWTSSVIVTPIAAVNESTFEHMKILFFSMLFYAVFEWFFLKKEYPNFWAAKLFGILLAVFLIPILFYTYKGGIGNPPAWLNILFFFLSAGVGFLYESKILKIGGGSNLNGLSFIILIIVAMIFSLFTYYPPKLSLFLDPINFNYGIQNTA